MSVELFLKLNYTKYDGFSNILVFFSMFSDVHRMLSGARKCSLDVLMGLLGLMGQVGFLGHVGFLGLVSLMGWVGVYLIVHAAPGGPRRRHVREVINLSSLFLPGARWSRFLASLQLFP